MTTPSSTQSELEPNVKPYIALGCLHIGRDINVDSGPGVSIWCELKVASLSDDAKAIIGNDSLKLLLAGWARFFTYYSSTVDSRHHSFARVYVLPNDTARGQIDRKSKSLKLALRNLLHRIDVSTEAWNGLLGYPPILFDPWASPENVSLHYLFNKLPSPAPMVEKIKSRYTRVVVDDLLESAAPVIDVDGEGQRLQGIGYPLNGLDTKLYPYQARSAALMIQREAAPQLQLDPRLEVRQAPNGEKYYFSPRDGDFLSEPRYFESPRGGILAESMGLGKTVICLAVILATKGHLPGIPPPYLPPWPTRSRVGSLLQMAANTIGRHSLPGRAHLEYEEDFENTDRTNLKEELARTIPHYEMPNFFSRTVRNTNVLQPRKFILCSATLIVVPRNLLHQWQNEIRKHIRKGGLKTLIMDSDTKRDKAVKTLDTEPSDMEWRSNLPSTTELLKYDIILFTRRRFEQEVKDGADDSGRRQSYGIPLACDCPYIGASRIRDCRCAKEQGFYESPLMRLHWLRIIVDEGHNFSSDTSNAVLVAKQLQAERRWVVSGTPAKDLVGVEVRTDSSLDREKAIESRKNFNTQEDRRGAVKVLGLLASNFLKVQPWHNINADERCDWDEYVYRHEKHYHKTYSAFSISFLRTLEGLVVKNRPEDVEGDIKLPPMTHRTKYLKPCWFDKMTANMFVQMLRANAITSERSDVDYLFHKNSIQARHDLMTNVRQSNFAWTGFSTEDVESTLETSAKYLEKEDKNCSPEDAHLLLESTQIISSLLQSPEWIALSRVHEVGLVVEGWPKDSEMAFGLAYPNKPTMVGITSVVEGQIHVDRQSTSENPTEGLEHVGEAVNNKLVQSEGTKQAAKRRKGAHSRGSTSITGVPSSALEGHQATSHKPGVIKSQNSPQKLLQPSVVPNVATQGSNSPLVSNKRSLDSADHTELLSETSALLETRVIGTTSAKLSYLLGEVATHHAASKIIIFYDGSNAAWYMAQGLEMLYIGHRIYAKTLTDAQKAEYVALFSEDPNIRVLLIDVASGALGLNLNAANRVYIINPINRPDIEAQAIKRAHRIGQTKGVIVETLVLEGTIEEAIFKRAKKMSRDEHKQAKTLEDDDQIVNIFLNAKVIPIDPAETTGLAQFAALRTPQQVFGRPGRENFERLDKAEKKVPANPRKRQRVARPSSTPKKANRSVSMTSPGRSVVAVPHSQLPILTMPAPSAPPQPASLFGATLGRPVSMQP
ncbi:SNF2 family N-terminal domain-domain-containing protein [Clohesyomyces aquaticus]|uniref:SNF2 family N-terminal domain-domain-containing protein n=1 Tax=Clohesyomyces aquaticus TaxID=1231657 RepID=A0A1Y1Z7K0_9PLEO|nr:SNF2 family N-terminal domain-domain-containing protein [Clohesyomyces aquaticus]